MITNIFLQNNVKHIHFLMLVQDRILQIIESKGLNKNSFSNSIGIQPQTLHHIVGGRRTNPSFEVIERIISTYSDINAKWLITGEGSMSDMNIDSPEPFSGSDFGSINKRFGQVIKEKQLTPTQMGEILGMTAIYVRKLTGEGNSFGIEPIKKILISFPDLNARWLLTGEGEPFSEKQETVKLETTSDNLIESQQRTIEKQAISIKNLSETIRTLSGK